MPQPQSTTEPTPGLYFAVLPGPTRRRAPGLHYYRLVYRDPGPPSEPGCAAVWDVLGGRLLLGGEARSTAALREGGRQAQTRIGITT